MRRKLKIAVIGIGAIGFGMIVIPPVENALLEQPSCLAFIGAIPRLEDPPQFVSRGGMAVEHRRKALAQNAIPSPKPPYVVLTRISQFNDLEAANILVAQKDARFGSWRVYEANQLFEQSRGIPSPNFTPQPTRILGRSASRKLDSLLRKRCLFNEPRLVSSRPRVWLSFPLGGYYYDGGNRVIEVNDGKRTGYFTQSEHAFGITGALGNLLVRNAIGFNYPPYRDPYTEPE